LELGEDVHVDRAVADAAATADAGAMAKLGDVGGVLVLEPVAPTGGLVGTRVVPRGVKGEEGELAAVLVLPPPAAAPRRFPCPAPRHGRSRPPRRGSGRCG